MKCYNLAGAFPQNMFFGADSQHRPGAGARGMWPNTFVPWPKLAGVLAAARGRGAGAGDTTAVCRGGVSAPGAGGDSPLTSTFDIYDPASLRGRHEMWCREGGK